MASGGREPPVASQQGAHAPRSPTGCYSAGNGLLFVTTTLLATSFLTFVTSFLLVLVVLWMKNQSRAEPPVSVSTARSSWTVKPFSSVAPLAPPRTPWR